MNVRDQIKRDEGFRANAYRDTEGIWTIGYGTNLQALEITEQQADGFMGHAIERATMFARNLVPTYDIFVEPRRAVIVGMIYNMGPVRFAEFHRMRGALAAGNFERAAVEMLDSKWAGQVGQRAIRLAQQMRTGEWT